MTLPCLLVASAPQIDLQAFIKAASGYAGQRLLDGQLRVCVCMCMSTSMSLWASVTLCDCVCLRLGPRLLPEAEFHSLLFHYSYKATARLHSAELQKSFFLLLSSLPSSTPPPPSLLSFMVTVGLGINSCGDVFLSILGFQGEAELDLSNFKHL